MGKASVYGRLLCCSALLFGALLCAQISAAANLQSAVRAYNKAEQARKNGQGAAALKLYGTAFRELSPLAKQGNAEAEALLGKMYLMGYGVLKDPAEAYTLFRAAGKQGNPDAEFFLGAPSILHHQNVAQGMEWLKLSAEQGNEDAQLLLGKTYLQGVAPEVRPDPVRADMWLRLASRDNLPFYKDQLVAAERQMSAATVAKGRALAAAWKPKHGLRPPVAGKPGANPAR